MSALFHNTHPTAGAVLICLLHEAPPWRKLGMVELMGKLLEENQ
jgi:hypothetical protein